MRAHEFLEERKKKRKPKNAAYGPGPYGWYGYDSGYSGDGGGVEENFVDKVVDTVKKAVTPNNTVKDMRDKVQSGQVKDAGSNSVFQKMSDRNKDMQQAIDDATKENFADGRNPQDKGDSKRHGVPTKASISTLRKVAKQGGRKGQLAHWMANM